MRTTMAVRLRAGMEHLFPEKRIFIKSETETRFVRLRPGVQALAAVFGFGLLVWSATASAILMIDSIGAGNFRDQAKRDLAVFHDRLNEISRERDARAREALEARARFNTALDKVSAMQSELMASETRKRDLETGIDVIQASLRKVMDDRDAARDALVA